MLKLLVFTKNELLNRSILLKHFKRIFFIFLLVAGVNNSYGQADSKFTVKIASESTTFKSGDSIVISMTVTNNTEELQEFCIFQTPFEGIKANIFRIKRKKKFLKYSGTIEKNTTPTKSDFITLAGGDSQSVAVNIADYYNFRKKGSYSIRFIGNSETNKLPHSNILEIIISK